MAHEPSCSGRAHTCWHDDRSAYVSQFCHTTVPCEHQPRQQHTCTRLDAERVLVDLNHLNVGVRLKVPRLAR